MANPDRQNNPKTARTLQYVQNSGFDEEFQVPTVELLAYNANTQTLDRVQINNSGQVLTVPPGSGTTIGDVRITDGTTVGSVFAPAASTTAQSGQNATIVNPATAFTVGPLTLNAGSPNSGWYDMTNFSFITASVTANTSTTITWQGTSDPNQAITSSWGFALVGNTTNSNANTVASGVTGNYYSPKVCKYFRVSSNASGGNSATVYLTFHTVAPYPVTTGVQAAISGVWGFESRAHTNAPTVAQVAASASNTTLKASNTNRRGLAVYNDADKALYLKLGTTASTTSFTVKIAAGGYYEIPQFPTYTGQVDGIWDTGPTGNAYVTEILT